MSMVVRVTEKTRSEQSNRDWEVSLEDIKGNRIPFILWETHGISGSMFSTGRWYRLEEVRGDDWDGKVLSSTSDTRVEEVPGPDPEPTKILHLSDTHIGYPLRQRSDVYDQDIVDWVEEVDCLARFRRAMEIAVGRGVDAVIHTGDVFDDVVEVEQLNEFRDILEETLGEADIPFYYILGNHDPEDAEVELRDAENSGLAEHLSRRTSTRVGGDVILYGIDHHDPSWWRSPPLEFDTDIPVDPYRVLCLHQSVLPVRPRTESSGPIDVDTIFENSDVDFDMLALGHEHYEEGGLPGYDCRAFYPGPTERISTKYEDREPIANLYTFSDGIDREDVTIG